MREQRVSMMLRFGVQPVAVIDGVPPLEKRELLQRRATRKGTSVASAGSGSSRFQGQLEEMAEVFKVFLVNV
mgnify:CR=1 FL=1